MENASEKEGPLNASEVLQILADIEVEGIEFYTYMEENCALPVLRHAARFLIEAETRHRERFLNYARNIQQYAEKRISFELLHHHARLLHNTRVFPSAATLAIRETPPGDVELLRIAIKAEQDNVVLIKDFKPYVLPEHHEILKRLIQEEQEHVRRLTRFMKKYFPESA